MGFEQNVQNFVGSQVLQRFLRYVQVHTTSNEESGTHPSTACQFDLAQILRQELVELGLQDVEVDQYAYVYATLPKRTRPGMGATPISFLAHLDTSPSVSGENVKPVLHQNYDGGVLRFADQDGLTLDPGQSLQLLNHLGDTIITASGNTLLGADDKAGIAQIMSGLATLQKFEWIEHPELRICFSPDEEIGEGTAHIRREKLGKVAYTFDGSQTGELEDECFDAYAVKIKFTGLNMHPGMAKNKMINAAAIAAKFVCALPEWQTPEHTELREGFIHLTKIQGNESQAELQFILRDFERENNLQRIALIESLKAFMLQRYPGLKISLEIKEQYQNMKEVLDKHPEVVEMASKAIEMAGIPVHRNAIRGGTDGAKLCFQGIPTPNIFAGGMLFHSCKEWVGLWSLEKATQVFLHLCQLWARV